MLRQLLLIERGNANNFTLDKSVINLLIVSLQTSWLQQKSHLCDIKIWKAERL